MKYVYDDLPTEDYFTERLHDLAKKIKATFVGDEGEYEKYCDEFFELAYQYMGIHYPECHVMGTIQDKGYITGISFHEYGGTMAKKYLDFEEQH